MQVYLVITDGAQIVITQKAYLLTKLDGHSVQRPPVVNQAGQWALPGGATEAADGSMDTDPNSCMIAAAFREAREELGVTLAPGSCLQVLPVRLQDSGGYPFGYVLALVPADLFNTLRASAKSNVDRGLVHDLEHRDVQAIAVGNAGTRLGHREAIPAAHAAAVSRRTSQKPTSQSIDWYALIAADVPTRLAALAAPAASSSSSSAPGTAASAAAAAAAATTSSSSSSVSSAASAARPGSPLRGAGLSGSQ